MDFIERWLHVSPDGGNGTLEAVYLLAPLAVIVAIAFRAALARALARAFGLAARR
jgi:hypothetical protein